MFSINTFPSLQHPEGGSSVRGWVTVEENGKTIAWFPNTEAASEYITFRQQQVMREHQEWNDG